MDFQTSSLQQTLSVGRRLGQLARPGTLLVLEGPLGAGKTSLVQGLAEGLGIAEIVNSPTFTLIKEYQGRLPLFHFDLYRLAPAELWDLGFEEYLGAGGVCALEWGERALKFLPKEYLHVCLDYAEGNQRLIRLTAVGEMHTRLAEELKIDAGSSY